MTHNVREKLVIHDLLRQPVNHHGQAVQQIDAYGAIGVSKHFDNKGYDATLEVIAGKFGGNLENNGESFCASAAKLHRLYQLRKNLHFEEFLGEVVSELVQVTVSPVRQSSSRIECTKKQ